MAIKNTEDENNSSGGNDGGNAEPVAAATAAPINATTKSSQNNMERSLPSEELSQDEKKPETRDYQRDASEETFRILGKHDAEADAGARSAAAGGHLNATEAAVTSIIKTDALDLSKNPDVQARVVDAARAARIAINGNMQDFQLSSGRNFDESLTHARGSQKSNDGSINLP